MPVGIDAEAERLRSLGVVGSDRAIFITQQSRTVFAADMKAHISGVATVEAMTVDAAFKLCILD